MTVAKQEREFFQDPQFVQELFNSTRFAWLWLVLRVWLGYKWVDAALHKVGNPDWVQTGAAVRALIGT
ncbi:MAG: DoxX family protein, partial [Firmicutes bacterium]|nr:DoxX family protein [Bacillota bacterium]